MSYCIELDPACLNFCVHILLHIYRADGGVCTNNFIMQLTADLLGRKIERPSHFDMSCLGAAFVAGLGTGKEPATFECSK